jgi:hypothetical protein
MYLGDQNMKEVARVQGKIEEHLLLGEVDEDHLDPETIADLHAVDSPESPRRPRPVAHPPTGPSAVPFYAGLFHPTATPSGFSNSGTSGTGAAYQAPTVSQYNLPALQAPTHILTQAPVIPFVSLPTPLDLLNYTTPPHIPDNGPSGKGSGKALNGINQAIYREATPAYLDYSGLLTYEITVLEMATYIPLGYQSDGFLSRTCSTSKTYTVMAKMMLWARSLDHGANLATKVQRPRLALISQHTQFGKSTSNDKTASTWAHRHSINTADFMANVELLRLRHGVTRPPQGQHRGRLTIAIEHAHANGHWGVMLSQVEEYIRHFNLNVPADLAVDADAAAMRHFEDAIWAGTH